MSPFRFAARSGALAIVAVSVYLAACSRAPDHTAIAAYAQAASDARDAFTKIAADYATTCRRFSIAYRTFQAPPGVKPLPPAIFVPNSPRLIGEVADADLLTTPIGETAGYAVPAALPAAGGTPGPTPPPAPDPDCSMSAKDAGFWKQLDDDYLDYAQGLGNLANVAAIPTPNPSPLASSLTNVPGINKASVADASKLGLAIYNFFEGANVDRDLTAYIQRVDKPISAGADVLLFIDATYANKLHDEFGQIDGRYAVIMRNELAVRQHLRPDDPQRLALDQLLDTQHAQRTADLAAINTLASASVDYASVVSKLATMHHKLYAASLVKPKFGDYEQIISQTVVPLYNDIQTLKKDTK